MQHINILIISVKNKRPKARQNQQQGKRKPRTPIGWKIIRCPNYSGGTENWQQRSIIGDHKKNFIQKSENNNYKCALKLLARVYLKIFKNRNQSFLSRFPMCILKFVIFSAWSSVKIPFFDGIKLHSIHHFKIHTYKNSIFYRAPG